MSKETVQAELNIELNVNCPHCGNFFDLFELDGGILNEDGNLIISACPDGHWIDEHKNFKQIVNCPECNKEINIEGIAW